MKKLYKRYQYWSKLGIVWTDWFECMNRSVRPAFKNLKEEYAEVEDPSELPKESSKEI